MYNKNIDDLMDYIMQPQQDGKKNKKKTKNKQRKGADGEMGGMMSPDGDEVKAKS